jgi:hypothetical protein
MDMAFSSTKLIKPAMHNDLMAGGLVTMIAMSLET